MKNVTTKTITLKIKRKELTPTLTQYVVKNGRKIHARIDCTSSHCLVSRNGCAYYLDTLEQAIDHVRNRAQDTLDMMGFSGTSVSCEMV